MHATEVTEQDYEELVAERAEPVLLDFYAAWCGPCKTQGRVLEKLPENGWHLVKIDIDRSPALARQYDVMGVPTLVFRQNGQTKKTVTGLQNAQALEKLFSELA